MICILGVAFAVATADIAFGLDALGPNVVAHAALRRLKNVWAMPKSIVDTHIFGGVLAFVIRPLLSR